MSRLFRTNSGKRAKESIPDKYPTTWIKSTLSSKAGNSPITNQESQVNVPVTPGTPMFEEMILNEESSATTKVPRVLEFENGTWIVRQGNKKKKLDLTLDGDEDVIMNATPRRVQVPSYRKLPYQPPQSTDKMEKAHKQALEYRNPSKIIKGDFIYGSLPDERKAVPTQLRGFSTRTLPSGTRIFRETEPFFEPGSRSVRTYPPTAKENVGPSTSKRSHIIPLADVPLQDEDETIHSISSESTDEAHGFPRIPIPSSPGLQCFLKWLKKDLMDVLDGSALAMLHIKDFKSDKELQDFLGLTARELVKELGGLSTYSLHRKGFLELKCMYHFLMDQAENSTNGWISFDQYLTFREQAMAELYELYPTSLEIRTRDSGRQRKKPPPYSPISPIVLEDMKIPRKKYDSTNPKVVSTNGSVYSLGPTPDFLQAPVNFWGNGNEHRERSIRSKSNHFYSYHHDNSSRESEHEKSDDESMQEKEPDFNPYDPSIDPFFSRRVKKIVTAKPRAAISEKIKWDGRYTSFKAYKNGVEGHLLQTGATYLLDESFQEAYEEYRHEGVDYLKTQSFYEKYNVKYLQADTDRTWLYGILVSTNRVNGERKIIQQYSRSKDGIKAWMDFISHYNNHGSNDIRAEVLEELIRIPYTSTYNGTLLEYLDKLAANLNELESLVPGQYNDDRKNWILRSNLQEAPGPKLPSLLQNCKDSKLPFSEAMQYLRQNGLTKADLLGESTSKRIHHSGTSDSNEKSYEDCKQLYTLMAAEMGPTMAFNTLQKSVGLRQQLQIPNPIWKKMSVEIRKQIMDAREAVIKEAGNNTTITEQKKKELPSQFNLKNSKDNNMDSKLAQLVEVFDQCDIETDDSEDDTSMDGTNCTFMVHTTQDDQESVDDSEVTIKAHVEYEDRIIAFNKKTKTQKVYAISDSGADTCVFGKDCHVESITNRHANLVGYDPSTTRSGKMNIVTALLKVKSREGIPLLIRGHEVVHNPNSTITLLSEYQIRENGLVIDPVATKHKTIHGYGTQTFYVSDDVQVPLLDRGGLMGAEILPYEDGDDEKYEIFDITQDHIWKPKLFKVNNSSVKPSSNTCERSNHATEEEDEFSTMPPLMDRTGQLVSYDPSDDDIPEIGEPLALQTPITLESTFGTDDLDTLLNDMTYAQLVGNDDYNPEKFGVMMDEVEKFSKEKSTTAFLMKSWHRVIHKDIDPEKIRPYLGYRPLHIVKKTLEKTTQLAKMVIRNPMRRHIKSRAPHLNVHRLNETVSTDPIFVNTKSVFHGYSCAQVFYGLKSHCINIYGMKSKGEFPVIYRDFIRDHGCPSILRRDNAKEEKSEEVMKIHRELYVGDQFCEPYNPQQNPVELRAIRWLKEQVPVLLQRTGAPDEFWFLAAQYLCDLHNHCADPSMKFEVPLTVRTGITKDISAFLQFIWFQKVLYLDHEGDWPASKERVGRFVGITQNIGDHLTYWIYDEQSKQVLARSVVRPLSDNLKVKFDPTLSRLPKRTASIGGITGLHTLLMRIWMSMTRVNLNLNLDSLMHNRKKVRTKSSCLPVLPKQL